MKKGDAWHSAAAKDTFFCINSVFYEIYFLNDVP